MTQTIAAIDLIRRSMLLINAIAADETPADGELNDGLLTLNEMIDSWNLQTMAVYRDPVENFVLTPGQATYNWGTTAGVTGITTDRPIYLHNVTCVRAGTTTPVDVISQDQYDAISLKSTPGSLIEKVLYINDFPLGRLTCFPVPTEAVTLTFNTSHKLVGPVTLQDIIAMPPGYLRALRYCLAVELWPEYSNKSTDIETVRAIAAAAIGKVKVSNIEINPATFENIPGVDSSRNWDWRSM